MIRLGWGSFHNFLPQVPEARCHEEKERVFPTPLLPGNSGRSWDRGVFGGMESGELSPLGLTGSSSLELQGKTEGTHHQPPPIV